jgi:mycofactocin precursor peptide peptidase
VTALSDSTWPEIDRRTRSGRTLLVPIGSTEQHGPHLPLTTDSDIAVALAMAAATTLPRVVVAPVIAFGSSGEHAGFPGTLSIGQAATELMLTELGRSAGIDFAMIVIVSTHGGNHDPVERAVSLLASEGHPVRAWSPQWGGDAHAGRTETSLMLAIAPERVRLSLVETGNTKPIATLMPFLRNRGVRGVSANGILGDPAGATSEEGRRMLDAAVDELVMFLGPEPDTSADLPVDSPSDPPSEAVR